jgi:molybdopterin-synthase adenylyltransferase
MDSQQDFSRQSFLGPSSESIFRNSRVAIIGCGGGGSHIAQQLAHIGVGQIILVDPDRIESSNLNRLVTASSIDVSQKEYKVNILARYIKSVRPSTGVIVSPKKWQDSLDLLKDCHFIFGCLDGFMQKDYLENFCRRYLLTYIDVGMDVHNIGIHGHAISGQVVVSIPGSPCLRCIGFLTPDRLAKEENEYGEAGMNPQVVWPNGVLASLAVGEFVKSVTPWARFEREFVWIEFDGNAQVAMHSRQPATIGVPVVCPHYDATEGVGDFN